MHRTTRTFSSFTTQSRVRVVDDPTKPTWNDLLFNGESGRSEDRKAGAGIERWNRFPAGRCPGPGGPATGSR